MNKILSTICLCRRASKLTLGFDAVVEELRGEKFGGVILAEDVSAKTEKEIRFYAEQNGKEVIKADFSMKDAEKAIGKRAGVFLINDEGLFGSVKKHI